jgi:branched-chain amino acid transport system permease protein
MVVLSRLWPLASLLALVTLLSLPAAWGSAALQGTITQALIQLVMVVGLYIFVGNSGVVSFGHAGFMLIAAYASAWLDMPVMTKHIFLPGLPPLLASIQLPVAAAAAVAMLVAGLVAFLTGVIVVRLNALAASIATLSFLAIANVIYSNWNSMTRGTASLVGLPLVVNAWVAYGCAAASLIVAFAFQSTRVALMLRASREDEPAAKSIGVSIGKVRLVAFVISAMVVGLGGVLQGHFLGTLAVDQFYVNITFLTLAMLVVGGIGSLAGAVVGTAAISVISELLRLGEVGITVNGTTLNLPLGSREVGLALLMLLILARRPAGITRSRDWVCPPWLQQPRLLAAWWRLRFGSRVVQEKSMEASNDQPRGRDWRRHHWGKLGGILPGARSAGDRKRSGATSGALHP